MDWWGINTESEEMRCKKIFVRHCFYTNVFYRKMRNSPGKYPQLHSCLRTLIHLQSCSMFTQLYIVISLCVMSDKCPSPVWTDRVHDLFIQTRVETEEILTWPGDASQRHKKIWENRQAFSIQREFVNQSRMCYLSRGSSKWLLMWQGRNRIFWL